MFEVATAEQAPGTIAQVLQPGYTIADRLLRPALVGVARAPANGPSAADGDEAAGRGGTQGDETGHLARGPRVGSSA